MRTETGKRLGPRSWWPSTQRQTTATRSRAAGVGGIVAREPGVLVDHGTPIDGARRSDAVTPWIPVDSGDTLEPAGARQLRCNTVQSPDSDMNIHNPAHPIVARHPANLAVWLADL